MNIFYPIKWTYNQWRGWWSRRRKVYGPVKHWLRPWPMGHSDQARKRRMQRNIREALK